jgi:hypothetical protein
MKNDFQNNILHHCQLKNNAVFLDGNCYFENKEASDFSAFAKSLYQFLDLKYAKFYKMDKMSKLGFLTFECLLKKVENFAKFDHEKTGLFLANLNSSLETDEQYWATTLGEEAHPSPSLFVYTLPNIVIGEMCIRHKIKGEHAFFVFEELDTAFVYNYVNDLLNTKKINACVVGWVESYGGSQEANFMWIERGEGEIPFAEKQLKKLLV